jgi:hypothetical protein
MTTAIVDQSSPSRLRPAPVGQPGRRPARKRGPLARPARPAPIPPWLPADSQPAGGSRRVVRPCPDPVRACRIDRAPRASTPWRLTDRGIALVLALTVMIVVAAVTVIGLTAWRVTAPGYQASGVSQQLSSR